MLQPTLPRRALLAVTPLLALSRHAAAATPIRIGTLRFGSLTWELDVMRQHGLVEGFALEPIEFASGPSSQVALQAGGVDVVLQDWIWTSRLRTEGAPWTFAPASAGLGAVIAPAGSAVKTLQDAAKRRFGIAGGPLDKSWLLLVLYARRQLRFDIDAEVDKVFGPPPLLAAQLEAGRLDAALTYWPFAARAEAAGARIVVDMADALAALEVPPGLPMLGYVFSDRWAQQNAASVSAFLAASAKARSILATSDQEWERIKPLTGANGPAELARLRDWYRRGAIGAWDDPARAQAERLFGLLSSIGGPALVGASPHLAPGTFWQAA